MQSRSITYGFEQRQSAQALVEFALILPLMLIMVLGSIDIGRALVFGVAVQNGAHEAARLGATTHQDTSTIVTDALVQQRLIDASKPALDACAPATGTWGAQSCGWTFAIDLLTNPVTSLPYTTITAAKADTNFSGSRLMVTATGQVSMWSGISTPGGWSLFPITARGQAVMVVQ